MSVLKGNFEPRTPVTATRQHMTVEQQFEKEALKRLGGSIAFVSKKKFLWTGEADDRKVTEIAPHEPNSEDR
jgi:hypothetical protein